MNNPKGLAPILIVVLVATLAGLILLVPFPYYQNTYCNEMDPPGCYPAGWKLKTPLWQEILGIPTQTVSYTLTSPTPIPTSASPVPNDARETDNWETYTNTKYGFEFKYPSTWSVIESKTSGNPYLAFITLGPTESIQSGGVIAIIVRNQTETEYISALTKEGFQIIQRINISLGANKASHYKLNKTLESGEKSEQEIVISMQNGVLYEINGGSNLHEQYKNIFDQILSTFRFTQ